MNKSLQKVIDTIQEHMAKDELIWHKPFIALSQANAKSKKDYRGINHLITSVVAFRKGYSSPFWATFKQIKEMGGTLKDAKGAGVPIIFYKELENDGEMDGSEGKRFVMRHSFVFNMDLVEGVDVKAPHPEAVDLELVRDQKAEEIVSGYLSREEVRVSVGNPAYIPSLDTVRMLPLDQFVSVDEYYSAYFHELAHSTGHNKRLSRFDTETVKYESKEDYSKEELVAEITAAFLCHDCGVDSQASIKNSAAYLKGWSKFITDEPAAFVSAVNQSYKARALVLGAER